MQKKAVIVIVECNSKYSYFNAGYCRYSRGSCSYDEICNVYAIIVLLVCKRREEDELGVGKG